MYNPTLNPTIDRWCVVPHFYNDRGINGQKRSEEEWKCECDELMMNLIYYNITNNHIINRLIINYFYYDILGHPTRMEWAVSSDPSGKEVHPLSSQEYYRSF